MAGAILLLRRAQDEGTQPSRLTLSLSKGGLSRGELPENTSIIWRNRCLPFPVFRHYLTAFPYLKQVEGSPVLSAA